VSATRGTAVVVAAFAALAATRSVRGTAENQGLVGPGQVLIVANASFEDSEALARYYARARSIPADNILLLELPGTEDIDRECFTAKLATPIQERACAPESGIRCIVLMRGVPLNVWDPMPLTNRIFNLKQQVEGIKGGTSEGDQAAIEREIQVLGEEVRRVSLKAASVDSELALLGREHELEGCVESPFLKSEGWPEGCFWTARLDASSAEDVRSMIDGAIEAEEKGLEGFAYFDARGLARDDSYGRMDEAIVRASRLVREKGLRTVLDTEESLFGADSCPDAAVFWGWYSLAKYVDSCTFNPGAIAVHVASGECNSLRSGEYWCRNLISNGAAVTMGPTNEPYLEAFPPPDDFLGALFEGKSVGEAYYSNQKMLSWRMVLLGDPLYRPFAAERGATGEGDTGQ
jgi:uncharacterized protein (TIGR03790 family)